MTNTLTNLNDFIFNEAFFRKMENVKTDILEDVGKLRWKRDSGVTVATLYFTEEAKQLINSMCTTNHIASVTHTLAIIFNHIDIIHPEHLLTITCYLNNKKEIAVLELIAPDNYAIKYPMAERKIYYNEYF